MKSRKSMMLALILALAIASGCASVESGTLVLNGTIEAESVHAGSRVGGRVNEVLVDEGSTVSAGDVLFTLERSVLEAERARAESMVREAEASYDALAAGAKPEDIARARQEAEALRQVYELARAGPLPEEIAAAESQAASLEAVYRNAFDAADRMERLYSEGAVSEREWVAARQAADAARNQWQSAVEQVDALKSRPREEEVAAALARYNAASDAVQSLVAGPTGEQLAAVMARVDTLREALDRLDLDLAECTVVAPMNGVVDTLSLKPGDFVAPGQPACKIVDMSVLKVVVYIPEDRLGFAREGAEVSLIVDSYPGEVFTGTINRVAVEAEFTPRNIQTVEERVKQVFAVEVVIENPDGRLRPGMAADVTVRLGQ
jgi:multidrug resistance efflux pump